MNEFNPVKFRNTALVLLDCKNTIETMISRPSRNSQLLIVELAAAKKIVGVCFEISELLANYAEIDIEHASADDMMNIMDMINVRCAMKP